MVMDVSHVPGYESGARKAWQTALWPHRSHVMSLTVVSDASLTRMGGSMFGGFLGIPHQSVSRLTPDLMRSIEGSGAHA